MEIDKSTGIKRLKFMTSHPKDLSDKLIATYGMANSLCNSIHLPVQSGSSEVLKRMNRRYSREDYMTLIKKLRKVSPNIAITTDIIVGFPGESEENFMETMDLVEKVRFDSAFTFLYSIRKGIRGRKILVANRGIPARRIVRSIKEVFQAIPLITATDVDKTAPFTSGAQELPHLGDYSDRKSVV